MANIKDLQQNIDMATPMFNHYLKNMSWELAQWIYLEKSVIEGDDVWFYFRSSGIPVSFHIYAGKNQTYYKSLSTYYDELHLYFQRVKWNFDWNIAK
jgi:hypothetical protein